MRIVVDTNIIVSAILFPNSLIAKIFEYVINCETLVLSQYIINETEKVFIETDLNSTHNFQPSIIPSQT